MEQKARKFTSSSVASIETEYVRSMQRKEDWRRKQKKRLKVKLLIFAIIIVVTFGGIASYNHQQKKMLASKQQEKQELIEQLAVKTSEQEQLKNQLLKLDDEEYIAKLARKEYFVSNKNEIIFSLPEGKKKLNKKDDGKE
ncbi:septum formation initiator family protein [Sporosarcina sp. BI001-red]|uniref:FtsB family cell division protein n=1 Tax=Sporosarcina sp. BI001-red TaxID=2282866 RepID=UPI000E27D4B4|nr:septum formation initiator family protein [Sporosarcina sp. BI001-red]REB11424.1 septum formation initiator family protein [Sporosarcina sp. BI001-red]